MTGLDNAIEKFITGMQADPSNIGDDTIALEQTISKMIEKIIKKSKPTAVGNDYWAIREYEVNLTEHCRSMGFKIGGKDNE